jgi:hypothetical protein
LSRSSAERVIGETVSLFYLLGGTAAQPLLIIGGLVPPLLLPGRRRCTYRMRRSLAITKGATRR